MAVFMTFSNDITINGNLYNTFKLVTTSRRLLQTSTAPTGYQIIIIDARTVQFLLTPGTTANNINVQIINPQNVIDANGNLPSSLSSNVGVSSS